MFYSSRSRHSYRERTPEAEVTADGGMLKLHSSYSEGLVAWLKALPPSDRAYNPNDKTWTVEPKHGKALQSAIVQFMGLTVDLPVVQQVAVAEHTETFEVRYLGGAYARGGSAERTATGYVHGEWKVIFGEMALRKWFGEHDPKPGDMPTRYGVLGVSSTADTEEIKRAYRKMARIWHPDVCKEQGADAQFRAIQTAYELLSDPVKREKYDAGLRLQVIVGGRRESNENVYFSPLRCGIVTALVKPAVGNRYVVVNITGWQDIILNGRMLVPTWVQGAKMFTEQWVEAVR